MGKGEILFLKEGRLLNLKDFLPSNFWIQWEKDNICQQSYFSNKWYRRKELETLRKNRESESFVISDIQQVMPGMLSHYFPKSDERMYKDKRKEIPCLPFKWKFLQTWYFRMEPSGCQACMHFNQSWITHRNSL